MNIYEADFYRQTNPTELYDEISQSTHEIQEMTAKIQEMAEAMHSTSEAKENLTPQERQEILDCFMSLLKILNRCEDKIRCGHDMVGADCL